MQIMCYLRIYDVVFPTNAELYLIEFTKIIEFDILNPIGIIRIWKPDYSYSEMISGAKSTARNLAEDLSILILAMLGFMLFCGCVTFIAFCKHPYQLKVQRFIKWTKQKIFYNMIIRSITISYLIFATTAAYQLKIWLKQTNQE